MPQKPTPAPPRNAQINVPVRPSEKLAFEQAANAEGLATGTWLRSLGLKALRERDAK